MDPNWFYFEGVNRRGPVDLERLLTILLAAPDSRKVKVWREGLPDWKDAAEIPEISAKLQPPGPSLPPRDKGTSPVTFAEAERVARLYRRLVLLVGVQFIAGVLVRPPDDQNPSAVAVVVWLAVLLWILGGFVALLMTPYRLVTQLGSNSPVLWAIGMCIPLINAFVLLAINSNAQAWCKRYGITVGFLGPARESLERLRRGDV